MYHPHTEFWMLPWYDQAGIIAIFSPVSIPVGFLGSCCSGSFGGIWCLAAVWHTSTPRIGGAGNFHQIIYYLLYIIYYIFLSRIFLFKKKLSPLFGTLALPWLAGLEIFTFFIYSLDISYFMYSSFWRRKKLQTNNSKNKKHKHHLREASLQNGICGMIS